MARLIPTRFGIAVRYALIRRLAKACGDNVAVMGSVYLLGVDLIAFGSNVSIHPFSYIDGSGGLEIGSDVSIAHGSSILTTTHDYSDPRYKIRDAIVLPKPTKIGSNVWLGAGSRVLAGVTVGENTVIGAGSVVTRDVPPNVVVAGVPARTIGEVPGTQS